MAVHKQQKTVKKNLGISHSGINKAYIGQFAIKLRL